MQGTTGEEGELQGQDGGSVLVCLKKKKRSVQSEGSHRSLAGRVEGNQEITGLMGGRRNTVQVYIGSGLSFSARKSLTNCSTTAGVISSTSLTYLARADMSRMVSSGAASGRLV